MRLENKVAIVTGATSGFGAAIARLFAAEGAHQVLTGRRADAGDDLVAELRRVGKGQAHFVSGDAGEERTAGEVARAAREVHGHVDILVLNAGINTRDPKAFWEVSPEEFDRVLCTNVRAIWLQARAAVPLLRPGASIVVMASQQSYNVCEGNATYAASKGAALQLARGMALDLAPRGVRVNALCPGICETPMTRSFIERAEDPARCEREFKALAPLGRFGTAQEIAEHTLFLASDQSSFITGIGLIADGGTTLR
jgi:NAD(P)-dependent dehydrogenase (short-subunit alcohol dehydrogenase family)